MTDGTDPWDALSANWQGNEDTGPTGDVARVVESRQRRGTLRLWLVAALEVLIVGAVVVLTATTLRRGPNTIEIVHLIAVWVVLVVALRFAIKNRRGLWRPNGESTIDYLSLCEERARRKLRTARFVLQLVLAQTVMVLALLAWKAGRTGGLSSLFSDTALAAVVLAGYIGWAVWFRSRAQGELAWATDLRRSIADAKPGSAGKDL